MRVLTSLFYILCCFACGGDEQTLEPEDMELTRNCDLLYSVQTEALRTSPLMNEYYAQQDSHTTQDITFAEKKDFVAKCIESGLNKEQLKCLRPLEQSDHCAAVLKSVENPAQELMQFLSGHGYVAKILKDRENRQLELDWATLLEEARLANFKVELPETRTRADLTHVQKRLSAHRLSHPTVNAITAFDSPLAKILAGKGTRAGNEAFNKSLYKAKEKELALANDEFERHEINERYKQQLAEKFKASLDRYRKSIGKMMVFELPVTVGEYNFQSEQYTYDVQRVAWGCGWSEPYTGSNMGYGLEPTRPGFLYYYPEKIRGGFSRQQPLFVSPDIETWHKTGKSGSGRGPNTIYTPFIKIPVPMPKDEAREIRSFVHSLKTLMLLVVLEEKAVYTLAGRKVPMKSATATIKPIAWKLCPKSQAVDTLLEDPIGIEDTGCTSWVSAEFRSVSENQGSLNMVADYKRAMNP